METITASIKNPDILGENAYKSEEQINPTSVVDYDLFQQCFDDAKALIIDPDTPMNVKLLIKNMTMCLGSMHNKYRSLEKQISITDSQSFQEHLTDIYSTVDHSTSSNVNALVNKIQLHLKNNYGELLLKSDTDLLARDRLNNKIESYICDNNLSIEGLSQHELITYARHRITGLDIVDDAVYRREDVDEIQIDDFNDIYYVIGGERKDAKISLSDPKDMSYLVNNILREAKRVGKVETLSETEPFLRTRLGENCRVSIVRSPIAIRPGGVSDDPRDVYYQIVIRKQKAEKLTLDKLEELGSIDAYTRYLLTLGVRCGISMLFYGGTGTGKTAGMGALLVALPHDLRTISMAEIEELNLRLIDKRKYIMVDGKQVVNKHYKRPFNSVLQWEFQTLKREMIKGLPGFQGGINAALTMTPDCIIVQETKGGEIKDLSNAALSGHQCFTSLHSSSIAALKARYVLMYNESGTQIREESILEQMPLAFQWLVGFTRFPGGFRAITDVTEITGYDSKTGKLLENPLVRYIVHSTTKSVKVKPDGTQEDIYTITGSHYAVNKPSAMSIEIMKGHGFLDSDALEFKSIYNSPRTKHKTQKEINDYYSSILR